MFINLALRNPALEKKSCLLFCNMMLSERKIDDRKGKRSGGRQKLMHITD